MIGTIITDVRIYTAAGSLVMQAQVGDKVEGSGNTITKLTRNGVVKLTGTYYVGQTGTVAWDEVTPPPDPTPTPVPSDKLLCYVLTQRERAFYEYRGGNIPDTRSIRVASALFAGRVKLTKELQKSIFEDNFARCPEISREQAIKEFVYLLNDKLFICNDAGSDSRRVYINYLNNGKDILGLTENTKAADPEMNQLFMGGQILELIRKEPYILPIFKNTPMLAVKTLTTYKSSKEAPYQWMRPAIIKWPQLNQGVFGCEPFDQFKARVRMPSMTNGKAEGFIDPRLVRILKPGEPLPTGFTKDWGS